MIDHEQALSDAQLHLATVTDRAPEAEPRPDPAALTPEQRAARLRHRAEQRKLRSLGQGGDAA